MNASRSPLRTGSPAPRHGLPQVIPYGQMMTRYHKLRTRIQRLNRARAELFRSIN